MQLLWSLLAVLYPLVSAHHDLEQVAAQLKSHLSSEAIVTFPWNPRWKDLQARASYPRLSPDYNAVVEVVTESDVQATISLANQFSIPFLAVSGGHGWSNSLKKFPYGIQINMRRMNTMTLSADGKTA
jgi:FAD/FMN-containing dehydrogenase